MTDTSNTLLALLIATEASVEQKLESLIKRPDDEGDPPEKWARVISGLMKTLADTQAQRAAEEAKIAAKTYTRYEDMPPPTPEDEARFYERFTKLVGKITDARGDGRPLG